MPRLVYNPVVELSKVSLQGIIALMNYKFFTSSEKAWKAMFNAISQAKKSVYLEMYIFQPNMTEFDFFHLLREKAREGVKVKIVIDPVGSADLESGTVFKLQQVGIEVLFFSYLLHRLHRKVLIVDEKVAFVGGVNLHKNSKLWNDLAVRINGGFVKKVTTSFVKSYARAGGKDPILLKRGGKISKSKSNIWVVEHSPVKDKFYFKRIYKKYLNKANKSIILITPYFLPKRWLSAALHQAVLRGVNVEILVPKATNHFTANRTNYFYIYKLSKLGVKFYLESKMNHAKAMIIDGKESMIGSQNLDFLSFDFNSEVGIFFKNREVASKLNNIAKEWKKDSVLFDYKTYRPRWFDYLLLPLIKVFNLFYHLF